MGLIYRLGPWVLPALLAAAARGDPGREYFASPGRATGNCPEKLFQGSDPGGGGNLTALPLTNNVAVRGHAEAGANDLAVPGSTIYFGMNLDPETEVLDIRVGTQSGDADIFAGPKL